MEKALISIVLPSYNHSKFICKTIQSVLNQTYSNFEFLIADDCSSDNSVLLIREFKDSRISLTEFEENQGAVPILNYLVEKSKGKYIAVINSDDYWEATKLEKQLYYLENNNEVGACFTWAKIIDQNNIPLNKKNSNIDLDIFRQRNKSQAKWLRHFYDYSNCLCHASILVKSNLIKSMGGYRVCLRQIPDYNMWIKIISASPIYIIEEDLVYYRWIIEDNQNTSSATPANAARGHNELTYTFMNFFNYMSDDVFIEGFSDLTLKKPPLTHSEILCEKVFLIDKLGYLSNITKSIIKLEKFGELLQNNDTRLALRKSYNFVDRDYFDISGKSLGGMSENEIIRLNQAHLIYNFLDKHHFIRKTLRFFYRKLKSF